MGRKMTETIVQQVREYAQNDEGFSSSDLALKLGCKKGIIGDCLRCLEKSGLLVKENAKKGGRAFWRPTEDLKIISLEEVCQIVSKTRPKKKNDFSKSIPSVPLAEETLEKGFFGEIWGIVANFEAELIRIKEILKKIESLLNQKKKEAEILRKLRDLLINQ